MDEFLFLAYRIPYPPNKGDKIRSYNLLSGLAARYRVHVGCFVDTEEDWVHADELGALAAETSLVPLSVPHRLIGGARAVAAGKSLTEAAYRRASLARWVDRLMNSRRLRAAYVFSSGMASHATGGEGAGRPRLVLDFVDVDSEKRRHRADRSRWPHSWLFHRERRLLLEHDRAALARCDVGLFVSDAEAARFRTLAPELAPKIRVLRNGIDTEAFTSVRTSPQSIPGGCGGRGHDRLDGLLAQPGGGTLVCQSLSSEVAGR